MSQIIRIPAYERKDLPTSVMRIEAPSALEIPTHVRNERDKHILPYYLTHDIDACVVEFGVSKSTINRAVRNPAALQHMRMSRMEAFQTHEKNLARFRAKTNLVHYRPKDTPTKPAKRVYTVESIQGALETRRKKKTAA